MLWNERTIRIDIAGTTLQFVCFCLYTSFLNLPTVSNPVGLKDGSSLCVGNSDGSSDCVGNSDGSSDCVGFSDGSSDWVGFSDGSSDLVGFSDGSSDWVGLSDGSSDGATGVGRGLIVGLLDGL
jgi:hypothetical protein